MPTGSQARRLRGLIIYWEAKLVELDWRPLENQAEIAHARKTLAILDRIILATRALQ